MRGEYRRIRLLQTRMLELPPRARRILEHVFGHSLGSGTTSACAENTFSSFHLGFCCWNYLRVRGEYLVPSIVPAMCEELPPRARRIRGIEQENRFSRGTTSACAENTNQPAPRSPPSGNYLRVRGEYHPLGRISCPLAELPPRARRIPNYRGYHGFCNGTTSACAENTLYPSMRLENKRNYLRVRGEYWKPGWTRPRSPELPPRARRILLLIMWRLRSVGTTSACAENTCDVI